MVQGGWWSATFLIQGQQAVDGLNEHFSLIEVNGFDYIVDSGDKNFSVNLPDYIIVVTLRGQDFRDGSQWLSSGGLYLETNDLEVVVLPVRQGVNLVTAYLYRLPLERSGSFDAVNRVELDDRFSFVPPGTLNGHRQVLNIDQRRGSKTLGKIGFYLYL